MKSTKKFKHLLVLTLLIFASLFTLSSCDNNHTTNKTSINESTTTTSSIDAPSTSEAPATTPPNDLDKCKKSYNAISSYLDYVGTPHASGESIKLTQSEYDNIDNVKFMEMKGEITFWEKDGYISSCTWTSFNYYTENEYRTIADDLCTYFGEYSDVGKKSYSNGNTYHYHWIDPYYGFDVTMTHGSSDYDPEGDIEIEWKIGKNACNVLGHIWNDATCTEPKSCKICNKIEGKALGHKGSELSEWDIDYDNATNVQEYRCTVCEETIIIQSMPITTFVDGNHFTIYSSAFANRFEDASSKLNNIDYYTKSEYNQYAFYDKNNTIFYRIQDKINDYKDIGIMSFTQPNGETVAVMNKYTENCIGHITMLIEDSWDVSAVVYSAILAIDPSIGYSEAANVGQTVVDNIHNSVDYNGINYLLYKDTKYHYLIISITPTA